MDQNSIRNIILESVQVKQRLLEDYNLIQIIDKVNEVCIHAFQKDRKLLFCGNGGSAADAQHLATEFTGRFYLNRAPLYADALHTDSSFITAFTNDYSFDDVFARQVQAKGRAGDVLIAISTSGNSKNIIKAVEQAKSQGVITIGMTGETGGVMATLVDHLINVPSHITPRIQESHIMIGHIICEAVEAAIFGQST